MREQATPFRLALLLDSDSDSSPELIVNLNLTLHAAGLDQHAELDVYNSLEDIDLDRCALLLLTSTDLQLYSCLRSEQPMLVLFALLTSAEQGNWVDYLRAGAEDVFTLDSLWKNREALTRSLQRVIKRAQRIQEVFQPEGPHCSLDDLRSDQEAARRVQQRLLPALDSHLEGLHIRYLIVPSLYLSGDFVDVISIDEHKTLFYLADVSGHGAPSALITVLLKNLTNRLLRNFRRASSFDILSPTATLNRLNKELLETCLEQHLTCFVGLIDRQTKELHYAIGGHHPLPLLTQNGETHYLKGSGMPLGIFPHPEFDAHTLSLAKDYRLTLFSDGILELLPQESIRKKENFIRKSVSTLGQVSPQELSQGLIGDFPPTVPDDVAIMVLDGHF